MESHEQDTKAKDKVCAMSVGMILVGVAVTILGSPPGALSQETGWTIYSTTNSGLPYNGVTALAVDSQGVVWVGTGRWWAHAGGGLAKFDGTNWIVYNTGNSKLPDNDHTGLSIDAYGNIWSGTENGLSKFDGTNWTVYRTNNSGLPSNHTLAPAFDANGHAWIATFPNAGLGRFDGENWTVYHTGNSGLPNNFVCNVTIDVNGNIWMSTFGSGVVEFDGQNWTVYNRSNSGLPHNDVCVVQADGRGNVWAGTYGGGIARFDGNDWTAYTRENSRLPHDWIWNLSVDSQGNAWAGTKAGLAHFNGVNWTVYNRDNSGLPDNNVYCVAFDTRENIWIGTQDSGLVRFRPQPIVDLNNDGIVDGLDMCLMIEHWHTDNQFYDIAPPLFGNGIVDAQDLALLAEHLFTYPGAVAYWKLDETEGDIAYSSVSDHDGILVNGPVWQSNSGINGGALEFDGFDDYIETPPILNPTPDKFSIFAWIKDGAPGQVILSLTSISDWLGADSLTGTLRTDIKGTGRSGGPLTSAAVITDGHWHRVGLVWNGTEKLLYVDDIEVARSNQFNLTGTNNGFSIGAGKNLEPGTFWSGMIDDVRMYNRVIQP
ncbi:two-component regulator propeller domain-containing protein [Planctomycetota bacterium]